MYAVVAVETPSSVHADVRALLVARASVASSPSNKPRIKPLR
jgi:hypothetical protein